MYTISEFARMVGVSPRMLRYYDSMGLLVPAVVDPSTAYRHYSIEQVGPLNRILGLRELGFSLAETRELMAELPSDEVQRRLSLRAFELRANLAATEAALRTIEMRLRLLKEDGVVVDDVIVRSLPPQRVVSIVNQAPGFGPPNLAPILGPAYVQLRDLVVRHQLPTSGPRFAFYTGSPETGDLLAYASVPVDDSVVSVESPGRVFDLPGVETAACVVRKGPNVYPQVYVDLSFWLEAVGGVHVGAGRDVRHHPYGADPCDCVSEINFPFRWPDAAAPDLEPREVVAVRTLSRN